MRTLRQRRLSDDREARWSRIRWAVDHTLSEDAAAQEVGASALYRLADDPAIEAPDAAVVEAALSELAARQEDALDALRDDGPPEDGQPEEGAGGC